MAERFEICPTAEISPGERRIVDIEDQSIGIFNIDGEYYGLANVCPHQLGELCRGPIGGTVTAKAVGEYTLEREGEIIRCPRHRWAFDITTGESVFNPHLRIRSYDVEVETAADSCHDQRSKYGTPLQGDEPPVDTYQIEVEDEVVVLYL